MGAGQDHKKRYPWRLGATSFVVPEDLLANVRLLAGLVDDVQLLFFESRAKARLPNPVDVEALRVVADDSALSYTAHLPGDIRLGAASADERQVGIDEIFWLFEKLDPLEVGSFDLHLPLEPQLAEEEWLNNLDRSFEALAIGLGDDRGRVCVENTDFPLSKVEALVSRYGFSVCMDVGHLLKNGYDWREELLKYLPRVRHFHYHGVVAGKDHEAVVKDQADVSVFFGNTLFENDFNGVVTLEMYELVKLEMSLSELGSAWNDFLLRS